MKAIVLGLTSAVLLLGLLATLPVETSARDFSDKGIYTKHFNETLFDITKNANFSVEVLLDDKEYDIGKDVIGIMIHGKGDKDVAGAELKIAHKKLQTGETTPDEVRITDRGNGLYIVSGLDLERDGRWELLITVKKAPWRIV
ncbi:MAG: hypothetical protein P8Y39_06580 [Nitrospirota bacterium]|jgi:hypothetical protein